LPDLLVEGKDQLKDSWLILVKNNIIQEKIIQKGVDEKKQNSMMWHKVFFSSFCYVSGEHLKKDVTLNGN
jgi:hypothetical protein